MNLRDFVVVAADAPVGESGVLVKAPFVQSTEAPNLIHTVSNDVLGDEVQDRELSSLVERGWAVRTPHWSYKSEHLVLVASARFSFVCRSLQVDFCGSTTQVEKNTVTYAPVSDIVDFFDRLFSAARRCLLDELGETLRTSGSHKPVAALGALEIISQVVYAVDTGGVKEKELILIKLQLLSRFDPARYRVAMDVATNSWQMTPDEIEVRRRRRFGCE